MSHSWPLPLSFPVAGHHRLAYRLAGDRNGEPWLLLHGGPGASCHPGMLMPLDLARQWAVAPDQRGCGGSRPRGSVVRNTAQALVSDLEALRRALGIERWSLLAGSWGTVVALLYAQRHPERVERLVMRGAFALSRREVAGLLLPRPALERGLGREAAWPRASGGRLPAVLAALRKVLQSGALGVASLRVVRHWNRLEMACAAAGLRRSLRHADRLSEPALASRIRRDWRDMQRSLRRSAALPGQPRSRPSDRRLRDKYRVQAHYLAHRGFVRPGELDRAVRTAARAGIAVDWVHGRFDAVCPVTNSQRWSTLMDRAGGRARLHVTHAGHLGHEADNLPVLRSVVRQTRGRSG